jgi:hypothetical protein
MRFEQVYDSYVSVARELTISRPRFSPPVASGMLNANDWQNLFAEANKKLKKDIPAQPGSKFLSLPGGKPTAMST